MLVEKNTFGQAPFCNSALISVPGAPAPSLATVSQPFVAKPGVEIWAPLWVAVALVSTFHPAVPRLTTALDPVEAAGPDTATALGSGLAENAPNTPVCASNAAT